MPPMIHFRAPQRSAYIGKQADPRARLPYNAGPLPKQLATVVRKVVRLGLPTRRSPQPAVAARAAA